MVAHNGLLIAGEQSLDRTLGDGGSRSLRTTLALPAPVQRAMVSPKRSTLLHQEGYILVASLQMCGEHTGAVLLDDSYADVRPAGVDAKNQVLGSIRGIIVQLDGKRGRTYDSCFLLLEKITHTSTTSRCHQRLTIFVKHIYHVHITLSPFIVFSVKAHPNGVVVFPLPWRMLGSCCELGKPAGASVAST